MRKGIPSYSFVCGNSEKMTAQAANALYCEINCVTKVLAQIIAAATHDIRGFIDLDNVRQSEWES
jgi:hypothetical protein